MVRDNFSKPTVRKLAENSSYICNNPDCRGITIFNTSGEKSSKCGIAAHICAASEKGPRFDSSQTPEERTSYENGIWLCSNCSILIDRDIDKYPKELLVSWKENHSKWLLENNNFRPYEDLITKFDEISKCLLDKNQLIHKYIPEIYSEISSIKDISRYFSNSYLFWNKIVDLLENINFQYLYKISDEFGIFPFHFDYSTEINRSSDIGEIYEKSLLLDGFLSEKKEELLTYKNMIYGEDAKKIIKSIPDDLQYKYENLKFHIYHIISIYEWKIEKILKLNKAIHSNILLVTSFAGKGKTNFLCDFSTNYLDKCNIPFIFVNALELEKIDEIELLFLKLSYLGENHKTFDHFASNYRFDFENRNKTLVIIIDGLNEVFNIRDFDEKIHDFLRQSSCYPYIKLICTCRTEFFEQRFKQLSVLPPSTLLMLKDFDLKMNAGEKHKLWQSYLEHFNIIIGHVNLEVYEKLTKNPLLLRIFSESHENSSISDLNHLYTETVFRKYFTIKIGNIGDSKECKSLLNIQTNKVAIGIFKNLIQLMITNKEYTNIKIVDLDLDDVEIEELSRIINEDILLKRDLETDDILDLSYEVINFTFDEMRDFLIANQLINEIYKGNPLQFSDFLNELLNESSSIYEGVSKFIYHISKKKDDDVLMGIVENQSWFEGVFIEEIFNVEDDYVTSNDVDEIKSLFLGTKSHCTALLLKLISNCNSQDKLNILVLFDIITIMTDTQYNQLLKSSFTINNPIYGFERRINLADVFNFLEDKLTDTLDDDDPAHYLFELLIMLMGADEPIASESYSVFEEYCEKYPHKGEIFFTTFEHIQVSSIKEKLQKICG